MFRNVYLETYKSQTQEQTDLEYVIAHFHQIYATLGCALQDLEFQVGRITYQNKHQNQKQSQPVHQPKPQPRITPKIQQETIPKINYPKFSKQPINVDEIAKNLKKSPQREQYFEERQKKSMFKRNSDKGGKDNDLDKLFNLQKEKVRSQQKNQDGTSSFDDLFDSRSKALQSERKSRDKNDKIDIIPHYSEESAESNGTLENFVDQMFHPKPHNAKK